jgi:hypothetical protein
MLHLALGGIVFAYNANMFLERNGRKTLTTVQGLPKKFDQKKILKVIKKKFGKLHNPSPPIWKLMRPSLQWHYRQRLRDGRGDPAPG